MDLNNAGAHYFVLTDGECPTRIVFDPDTARASNSPFIDCFDGQGLWIAGFKLVDGDYSRDF